MIRADSVQGYLAHKKQPPRRTLQYPYGQGPRVILDGWAFLMNDVPLHRAHPARHPSLRTNLPRQWLQCQASGFKVCQGKCLSSPSTRCGCFMCLLYTQSHTQVRPGSLLEALPEEDYNCSTSDRYMGTSLIRNRNPLGPCRRPMPGLL